MIFEKVKRPALGKLCIIQSIEANIQLGMQIDIRGRNSKQIEKDNRLLKFNCRLRLNYSTSTATLEK